MFGNYLTKSFFIIAGLSVFLQSMYLNHIAHNISYVLFIVVVLNAVLMFFSKSERKPEIAHTVIWLLMPTAVGCFAENYLLASAVCYIVNVLSFVLSKAFHALYFLLTISEKKTVE